MPRRFFIVLFLFISACSIRPQVALDLDFGEADSTRYETPVAAVHPVDVDYWGDVDPILKNRCTVCHGCYDSPCQLNLASYEGLTRGASKDLVYNAARLRAASPSRLFVDAQSNSEWRDKDFYPVLNERSSVANGDKVASVIRRILALKDNAHAPLNNQPLSDELYDFSLKREQTCPLIEEMDAFEIDHPDWGMPFGLPALSADEYSTLSKWIEAGAPYQKRATTFDQGIASQIASWESFLNQNSLKARLMSRYIYEHWFLAHLYFDDVEGLRFFQLVRSSTKPGEPISLISTRRPYDDPGISQVYYRLQLVKETILSKTHMPYVLNDQKMQNIEAWFLEEDYEVDELPSYEPTVASNPFKAFADIPVSSRYRFMLEEARFSIMGFIKGPVCRGQIALNVINDHFWVVFADPDNIDVDDSEFDLRNALENIRLPAETGSSSNILSWRKYAKPQKAYLEEKSRVMNTFYGDSRGLDLGVVWDGGGSNKNAALSVFRHFDTASVEYGLLGENPQTIWLIEYPLLEKIHYLLVAGFDVYGNYGHQLNTRLYMDFLRMEGEYNFLTLLPKDARNTQVEQWYRGDTKNNKKYFNDASLSYNYDSAIEFNTDDPYREIQGMLKDKLSNVLDDRFDFQSMNLSSRTIANLKSLSMLSGRVVELMPELAMISLAGNDGATRQLTLLHNSAYSNVGHLLAEKKRRLPEEDGLTLLNGFIGAYPNAYFSITEIELEQFVSRVSSLASDEDYSELMQDYGIRRTHPDFWQHSDRVHQAYQAWNPVEYGLLDYNRLENR